MMGPTIEVLVGFQEGSLLCKAVVLESTLPVDGQDTVEHPFLVEGKEVHCLFTPNGDRWDEYNGWVRDWLKKAENKKAGFRIAPEKTNDNYSEGGNNGDDR